MANNKNFIEKESLQTLVNQVNENTGDVKALKEDLTELSAEVTSTSTLTPNSNATASATWDVDNNKINFTFGIPKGDKGDPGVTPTIKPAAGPNINSVGTPTVTSTTSGTTTTFTFDYLKGAKGDNATTTEVATQTKNGLMSAADKVKVDNFAPLVKGTGSNSIKFADGVAAGDYSIAGGTASKDIINNMVGSIAGMLVSVKGPEANGSMTLALGTNTKSNAPGAMAFGFGNTSGVKGYYWWSFNTSTKVIELSTNRPALLTSRQKPSSLNWAVGDLIVINNGSRYSNIRIKAVDTVNMTIIVDNIPFTTDEYKTDSTLQPYSHDTPNDRFIYAFKENSQKELTDRAKPRWEARGGEIEFGFVSSSKGIYNISAGMLSTTENYNNLAVSDYAHVEGRNNIGGYGAHVEGSSNEGWGRDSHTEGHKNINNGSYTHVGGYNNKASSSYSFVTGQENELTENATQSFASGRANYIEGTDSIAVGRGSKIYSSKSSSFGGRNKLSLPSGSEGYQFSAGQYNNVNNPYGVAFGYYSNVTAAYQTVLGKCNAADSSALLIIGNGNVSDTAVSGYAEETNIANKTVYTSRKNVFTVKTSGQVIGGRSTQSSDDGKTLATKDYVDGKGGGGIEYTIGSGAQGYVGLTPKNGETQTIWIPGLTTDGSPTFATVTATSFNATSDARLKTNIKDFTPEKSILDLQIKEFDYISSGNHAIGCIAQDLQEICPEIVNEGEDGYLSIQESKIIYLLLNEMKKLRAELNELKGK